MRLRPGQVDTTGTATTAYVLRIKLKQYARFQDPGLRRSSDPARGDTLLAGHPKGGTYTLARAATHTGETIPHSPSDGRIWPKSHETSKFKRRTGRPAESSRSSVMELIGQAGVDPALELGPARGPRSRTRGRDDVSSAPGRNSVRNSSQSASQISLEPVSTRQDHWEAGRPGRDPAAARPCGEGQGAAADAAADHGVRHLRPAVHGGRSPAEAPAGTPRS